MLVPRETESYAQYEDTRDVIAHARDTLLPINSERQAAREFGLHPSLVKLQSHYNAGNAAFVSNVGTLLRPITKAEFNNRANQPLGLFSHADQQMHWHTALPQVRGSKPGGWGGRTADLIAHPQHERQSLDEYFLSGGEYVSGGESILSLCRRT
jgi:uncharacterized protein (DUF1501 family)